MEQKILDIMKSVFKTDSIDESCNQQNCEKWDSMNHLNLVVELEMEFGVSFEPEEIAKMQSYQEVLNIVKSKLS